MRVLDLFSGLNGWNQPFADHGHEVFRIDNDPRFEADLYHDVNDIDQVMAAVRWRWSDGPDVIFSSPPCNSFSVMTMGRMWTHEGQPKHPLAEQGQRNVISTLKLVLLLRPRWWLMENPRARLRTLDLTAGLPRRTITQCQYGAGRMKPTDLWGVFPGGHLRPMCRNGDPCHVRAPRGSTTGTQGHDPILAARIPYALADAMRVAMEARLP